MAKKWNVNGTIRADIHFQEIITANTQKAAIQKVRNWVQMSAGITSMDIVEEKIDCFAIKEWGNK